MKCKVHILLHLLLSGLTLFLLSRSALLQGNLGQNHIDSEVYMYTASQWLDGKVLYKEVFDHKGPLMYVFDALGLLMFNGNPIGVWIVQSVFLLLCFNFLFRYFVKEHDLASSLIAILFFISWFYRFMSIGDNIPEIFALGFVALSIGIFLRSRRNINVYNSFFLGISCMGLFLLKPNLVVLTIPICIYYFSIIRSMYLRFIFLIAAVLGALFLSMPFLIYLWKNEALLDAYDAIWKFNLQYIGDNKLSFFESIHQLFFTPLNKFLIFIFLLIPVKCLLVRRVNGLGLTFMATLLFSICFLIGISGRGFESLHYLLPLAPFCFILFFDFFDKNQKLLKGAFLLLGAFFLYPGIKDLLTQKPKIVKDLSEVIYLNQVRNRAEDIFVIGNSSSIYRLTELKSPCRYFYTYPILGNCASKWTQECVTTISIKKPTWLYVEHSYPIPSCFRHVITEYEIELHGVNGDLYLLSNTNKF